MFKRLLIANRGEIACRVIRTARRLGVRCIAVYSDADEGTLHVAMADDAYRIGPPPARESYLDVEAILGAAARGRADAIHPGYGFLSENAEFAEACAARGIVFVGPPAGAIRAMGSKSEAKRLMAGAGVPLVPGYHGTDQSPERLRREAEGLGWPVLLKASAGGGGRGMRAVERAEDFDAALAGAKREAAAAFGDDSMLIERYVAEPRHVEVQVFADRHGNFVHLFERDCSAQRRHQKVIEEAPAPGAEGELRAAMCEAATAAARAIGYEGGGDRRVPARPRRGVLVHGDEHPAPGRAPGDRARDRDRPRRMAAPGRERRARPAHPGRDRHPGARHRGAPLRGRSGPRISAFHRAPGPPPPARERAGAEPGSESARRSREREPNRRPGRCRGYGPGIRSACTTTR